MKLRLNERQYILTEAGIDISLPLSDSPDSVLAWYCEPITIEPVMTANFVGEVKRGGSVNFRNVTLNLHGNGTHTECVGHISKTDYSLNQCLKEFHFPAQLVSVRPKKIRNEEYQAEDEVIDRELLVAAGLSDNIKALVIRTPNLPGKKSRNYSNTNPPYITGDAVEYLNEKGIDHLLIDLPSVDRETDGGKLAAHHLFWNYPNDPQAHKTITELIYVPEAVQDGIYLLNIQITSLETDASPSKPMLYRILEE